MYHRFIFAIQKYLKMKKFIIIILTFCSLISYGQNVMRTGTFNLIQYHSSDSTITFEQFKPGPYSVHITWTGLNGTAVVNILCSNTKNLYFLTADHPQLPYTISTASGSVIFYGDNWPYYMMKWRAAKGTATAGIITFKLIHTP